MFEQPFPQAAALLVVLWPLAPTAAAAGSPHYTVVTDERLEHLDVRACFEGTVPRRLTARDERAADLLRVARLHTRDDVIELKLQGSKHAYPVNTGSSGHKGFVSTLSKPTIAQNRRLNRKTNSLRQSPRVI